jgi:hypothetical protein
MPTKKLSTLFGSILKITIINKSNVERITMLREKYRNTIPMNTTLITKLTNKYSKRSSN